MLNYSQPPIREPKTHEGNGRAVKHLLDSFSSKPLAALTADEIELYLRIRLRQKVRRQTLEGFIELATIKPATVHQEFRVLRRMLNVAVRRRLLPANPCWGMEFPVRVKGLFRPHYMSWQANEQHKSFDTVGPKEKRKWPVVSLEKAGKWFKMNKPANVGA